MKPIFKIMTFMAFFHCFQGHLDAQQVLVPTGSNASNNNGSVGFTYGQVFYASSPSGEGQVTQGVQQPFEIFVSAMPDDQFWDNLDVALYPIPADKSIVIEINVREYLIPGITDPDRIYPQTSPESPP